MKIIKESKRLIEEDNDKDLSDINLQNSSKEEIADAVKNSLENNTDGKETLSSANADRLADEIQDVADDIKATKAEILSDINSMDKRKTVNTMSKKLDSCLTKALDNRRIHGHAKVGTNLLVVGLPGAAKTATLKDGWLKEHSDLVLCELNATDPKIEQAVNGMPYIDKTNPNDPGKLVWKYAKEKFAPLLDPKNEAKCILFVDEFNRQNDLKLRRSFLSLFNEKRNADSTLDFSKTLLFTVVCINPALPTDRGATELIQAEMDRMFEIIDVTSTTREALYYFNNKWGPETLQSYGIALPGTKLAKKYRVGPLLKLSKQENEDVNSILKEIDLANYILTNDKFHFDGEGLDLYGPSMSDLLKDLKNHHAKELSQRTLTDLILNSKGDKKEFLNEVKDSRLLDDDRDMLKEILQGYVLDLPQLRKNIGLDGGTVNIGQNNTENTQQKELHDDESKLFNKQVKKAKGSNEIEDRINAMMADLDKNLN